MTAIVSDETAAAPRAIRPVAAYAAFSLTALLCFFPTVVTMVRTWANTGSYHHGFLIAPLVLWLIWREECAGAVAGGLSSPLPPLGGGRGAGGEGSRVPHARQVPPHPYPSPPTASGEFSNDRGGGEGKAAPETTAFITVASVGLFSMLWLAGRAISANIVEQFAFVSLLIAGAVLAFGAPWARARAFPLALLYFMVPFGTSLAPPLQNLAAAVVTTLLNVAQIDTASDGLILSTATGRFEIAEGCAGLNFLLASLVIGAVYGALAIRGWKKRLALIAALAALSVVANLLRIFLVIAITAGSGGRIELAADHLLFGWALYGVLLAAFMLFVRRFADPEAQMRHASPVAALGWRPLALALLIVVATAAAERLAIADPQSSLGASPLYPGHLPSIAKTSPLRGEAARGGRGGEPPRVAVFTMGAEPSAVYRPNSSTGGEAPPLPPLALSREGGREYAVGVGNRRQGGAD